MRMNNQKQFLMPLMLISFGILTRLIPHTPNFSPEVVFALYLGMKTLRHFSYFYVILMAIISDLLLSWQHPSFASFGSWTIFTYSALLAITWVGGAIKHQRYGTVFISTSFFVTLCYWTWTNFGVWLAGTLYPHTPTGFIVCYTLALPFLASSLAAGFAWSIIIMLCENYSTKSKHAPLQMH